MSSVLIVTTLWKLWLARNTKVFDNVTTTPNEIYTTSMSFANEIVQSFSATSIFNTRNCEACLLEFPQYRKAKAEYRWQQPG